MLSRNKTIKILHDVTGEPYKVCRAKLKANKWDIIKAVYPEYLTLVDSMRDFFYNFGKALREGLEKPLEELSKQMNQVMEACFEERAKDKA